MSSFNYYWQSPYPVWGRGPGGGVADFPPDPQLQSSQVNASSPHVTCGNQPVPQPTCGIGTQPQQTVHVKVVNPSNKRDCKLHTLRNISQEDLDSPSKIKDVIFSQCGDEVVPLPADMEIGYFRGSNKLWINNRLDVNDVWKLVNEGKKVTF